MLFKKFYTELMLGLMKDLVELLNQLTHNILISQLTIPLKGNSYIDLPIGLKHPRKGLINIKNYDQKCFLWCHLRHINHLKSIQKELQKLIEKLLVILIMIELNFL